VTVVFMGGGTDEYDLLYFQQAESSSGFFSK